MPYFQRVVLRGANNHVIDEVDADDLRGLAQLPGQLNIRCTRRRVAAGVVVLCDEPSYVECMRSFHSGFALRVGWIAAHS